MIGDKAIKEVHCHKRSFFCIVLTNRLFCMNHHKKKKLFSEEYSELFDYLYRYVCYRVPEREEAEDLVSESFLQAYHRLDDFDSDKGTLRQWLTGIAKNTLLMYWRRRSVQVDLDAIPELHDPQQEQIVCFLDQRLLVDQLLCQLSDDAKALVAFRYTDGLSHEEIAQLLGKHPAAVRKFFSRLHERLRNYYQKYYA